MIIKFNRLLPSWSVLHRTLIISPEIQKSVSECLKSPQKVLTPAETAFAYRLGIQDLPQDTFRAALAHPKLPQSRKHDAFENLMTLGGEVLELFVRDYIKARFARLPNKSHELATKIYTTTKNLSAIAKSIGVEYAVIEFTGIPSIKMPTLEAYCNSSSAKENLIFVRPTEVYAEIFKAIIGAIFKEKGALATRNFLDGLLFTATFNKILLCRPKNPMLKLAYALRNLKLPEPDYRLLHETGRLSNTSIYVVGIYSGTDKLAEAHGPSLLIAQERAAIEALRSLFLVDTPKAPRKSDQLLTTGAPSVNDKSVLAKLLSSK